MVLVGVSVVKEEKVIVLNYKALVTVSDEQDLFRVEEGSDQTTGTIEGLEDLHHFSTPSVVFIKALVGEVGPIIAVQKAAQVLKVPGCRDLEVGIVWVMPGIVYPIFVLNLGDINSLVNPEPLVVIVFHTISEDLVDGCIAEPLV